MRLALAQLNPLVGDLAGNAERILRAWRKAAAAGADLVLTPELSLWGYPPRDLLLHPARLAAQTTVLDQLAGALAGQANAPALLVGIAETSGSRELPNLHNALALVDSCGWRVVARKQLLPTYDVFDEQRYFRPGSEPAVLELRRGERPWRLGLTVCEDLWVEEELQGQRLAGPDPVAALRGLQVELLINLSASPFSPAKTELRHALAARAAQRLGCPVVYVNQVGGNDELVFDGASFVVESSGAVACQLPSCREGLEIWSPTTTSPDPSLPAPALPPPMEQVFRALVLGVRDYARKCGFQCGLLGLSGGIDSALVAVIATAALGPAAVRALLMPSPWSSAGSVDDASALAQRLGLRVSTVPIGPLMAGFDAALQPALGHAPTGLTAENLQSRIRGTLLMAVANQEGQLLLSTGNKSELAVGYCTLYGDMNGGLSVIGDLYKSTVFALAAWLDSPEASACRLELGLPAEGELVGRAIRAKPPSAELRPDQRDSDSLPEYDRLDPLLEALVEERRSVEELAVDPRFGPMAEQVARLLRRAEFKRRQAAPVLKVSGHAFDSGWRMPIAAG
ncbi:glutamine dependent NAD+ synthetase [Cyanobium sp. PCC 7001]|uniref:NAD+ synthase n=1 Tax=Cyanobium sp. PCC 7001 TaxID=180281 RepID=UPI0001805C4C|nr:NAD+ synthase [Cyanobium sp. PCC 7001]EDY39706.1 glutamine dependent NAD+ synthetase [Cyanobium sp. PCC 7001]